MKKIIRNSPVEWDTVAPRARFVLIYGDYEAFIYLKKWG